MAHRKAEAAPLDRRGGRHPVDRAGRRHADRPPEYNFRSARFGYALRWAAPAFRLDGLCRRVGRAGRGDHHPVAQVWHRCAYRMDARDCDRAGLRRGLCPAAPGRRRSTAAHIGLGRRWRRLRGLGTHRDHECSGPVPIHRATRSGLGSDRRVHFRLAGAPSHRRRELDGWRAAPGTRARRGARDRAAAPGASPPGRIRWIAPGVRTRFAGP